jgi:pectate lyase-like protein
MPDTNPGVASSVISNSQPAQIFPGTYTFATLPPAANLAGQLAGVQAYTTDEGLCYWNGASWVSAAANYSQTAQESAAGVVPTNLNYPPGNILRYGADPTGIVDSASAIRNSIASNDYTYIPRGQYLVNSQISINRAAVTIEGANPWWQHTGVYQGGSLLKLGSAAGSGAAVFAWTAAGASADYGGLVIQRLGINLNNPGLQQIGIRIGQALNVRIDNVTIIGQGTSSDDTVGIQFDGLVGPYTYSGDIVISRCYIANHLTGISLS